MTRRRVLLFAVGLIGAIGGSAVTTWLVGRRCMAGGGTWNLAQRTCSNPTSPTGGESMAGFAVTILLAILLYRLAMLVAARQHQRSSSSSRSGAGSP